MSKETFQYQTEVQQLLDLVIHSLYSNKDIFLRELISNASDAIDKIRFDAITDQNLLENNSDWKIKLAFDESAKTITVSDNGIGMSKEEVIENIGTIAKSGTKEFLKGLQEKNLTNNPEFIGQFGVGFYSSFMIADKVTLITKRAGEESKSVLWESVGDGSYTVEETTKAARGTDIILHLKEEALEYLSEWKIKDIVKRYSDYVEHPIVMDVEKEEKAEEGKEPEKKVVEEVLNSQKAIWAKPKKDISEEEYKDFYKHISHDFTDPLETIHYHAEGSTEFKALLYIPAKAPMDIHWKDYKGGLNLYVKRVFIMHDCKKIIPEYMRFLKGVVDSSDLPLNVSREILQEDRNIEKLKKNITSKIIKALQTMQEKESDKYLTFYKEFGRVLKEGLHYDFDNKDQIKDLLLFETTKTEAGKMISLKDYKARMPEDQKEIFYINGEERKELESSPLLEAFKKKGYEVIFMTDHIDEFILPYIYDYDKVKLQSVEKGDLELDTETKQQKEEKEKEYKSLLDVIKDNLKEEIKDVRLSSRLTDSASCLVAGEDSMTKSMEQLLKSMGQAVPSSKRVLEINPNHKILEVMDALYKKDQASQQLKDYSLLLYDQALLTEGSKVKDPQLFAKMISDLMVKAGV
ncbi:MAG: molecular chaperone HtpG [Candidatus Margulisiibacteriota bacterium]|nr:MAG: molecular chaperone HtpG [Candidatus Margulisbacteria bacterium GWD2_39_127]OGI00885.1 MAG: molecular chaperone HtpG [Candidatus Margulisbacteria bacterium GWF2_38_17]OGI08740.1 MAG: molecular chaperone HtpG [Candidatus Margulisbacteria bacterium GWE2_39_32]PZM79451.1 MAG: molecular chaperone HtpG [Candidatus Margulisiibacteriota bacterium]HAR63495.1 molecular chaperone HtpG [Candidatus Margulisiibacteriota bacterium]